MNEFNKAIQLFIDSNFKDNRGKTTTETEEIDLNINVRYYDKDDTSKTVEKRSYQTTLELLREDINSNNYIIKNDSGNEVNLSVDVHNYDNSDISNIIRWSRKYPNMQIDPQHVVMLKDFQSLPANRFMVLRRYNSGVPDNIFTTWVKNKPISTMVGYYDLNDNPITISHSEKWDTESDAFFETMQEIIGIRFDTVRGLKKIIGKGAKNPYAQDLSFKIMEKLGFMNKNIGNPYGNANLIHEAARRVVDVDGLQSSGFKTDFNFEFKTIYEYRDINGTNGQKILKNLIKDATVMGAQNAIFLAGEEGTKKARELFDSMASGDISKFVTTVVTEVFNTVRETLKIMGNFLFGDEEEEDKKLSKMSNAEASQDITIKFTKLMSKISGGMGSMMKSRYMRYEWKIKGVLGSISGSHTAPWHLTMGNPKAPWFSMGNLILENMSITPMGDLMYDDFPSKWEIKCTLRNGRSRGGSEVFRCFNPGKAREYTTIDRLNKLIDIEAPVGETINIKGGISIDYDSNEIIKTASNSKDNKEEQNRLDSNSKGNNEDLDNIPEIRTPDEIEQDENGDT